jgi:protein O-mannosyl-transferase
MHTNAVNESTDKESSDPSPAGGPFPEEPGSSLPTWWPAALLAGITAVLFAPSLWFDLVYDARIQILTDTFLHDPRHWFDVLTFRVLAMDVFDFNRPMQIASLMLDATFWGKNPFGYHLTSVAIHVANSVLVWMLVREVTGRAPGALQAAPAMVGGFVGQIPALLAALVFAVHPVVAEAVCDPSYREDLLVTLFSLVALLLAMRHDPETGGWDVPRAIACVVCSLLAVASKESAFATPLILAASWWLFRRKEPAAFWAATIVGSLVVTVAFLAARLLLEPATSVIYDSKPGYLGGSLGQAVLIQPRLFAFYLQLVAFPVNLCADYGGESVRHLSLAAALAALLGAGAAGALAARQDRRLWFAYAVVLLPLIAVSNLIPIYRPFADRYLYYPMVGVALVVACLLDAPWLSADGRRRANWACLAAVVALALTCSRRERVWRDELALWTDTYPKNQASISAMVGLANGFRVAGRPEEAEKAIQQVILFTKGEVAFHWAILAVILDDMGREEPARRAWNIAMEQPLMRDPDTLLAQLYCEEELANRLRAMIVKYGNRHEPAQPRNVAPQAGDGDR